MWCLAVIIQACQGSTPIIVEQASRQHLHISHRLQSTRAWWFPAHCSRWIAPIYIHTILTGYFYDILSLIV